MKATGSIRKAFTLIELMVVISILALLISILLPSFTRANDIAKATSCSANMNALGKQLAMYSSEFGVYPPSYLYPKDADGNWSAGNGTTDPGQDVSHPYGYMHWSYFLLGNSQLTDKSFRCPAMTDGGIPRTNPGPEKKDWNDGQHDQSGGSINAPSAPPDHQAPRMAFTGNAAVLTRNKYTRTLSGGQRVNRWVSPAEIKFGPKTIIVTEFLDNWQAITDGSDSGLVNPHRPLNPFSNIGSGTDEYASRPNEPGFVYGDVGGGGTPSSSNYGLLPYKQLLAKNGSVIDGSVPTEMNGVGRHHPLDNAGAMGGAANFLYVDGHVERKNVLDTLKNREWGDRYYGLTGDTSVLNYYKN